MRVRAPFVSNRIHGSLMLFVMLLLVSCDHINTKNPTPAVSDSSTTAAQVSRLIAAGDASYAQKSGYQSFLSSLKYYDSARAIADSSGDTLQIAEAIFAKARVYDAWNKDPQKTIELFTEAATYFKKVPEQEKRYLYVKHLVAHAYDKFQDSLHATAILRELYTELAGRNRDSLQSLPFTSEMALIATEVRDYPLADSILYNLTRREWIANDSLTYDYLNHYYLTQSRLDVFWRKPSHSYYLDSIQAVYNTTTKMVDQLYYSYALASLYRASGDFKRSSDYYALNERFHNSLNNRADVSHMQNALLQSELRSEKRKQDYEEAMRTNRLRIIWLLGGLLSIITALSLYLYRQARKSDRQAERLASLNSRLDERIRQVEVLNKEIHHRVKNNLHMIYSLLQMQERKTDSEDVIEALQAARLRVESVAALHNQLLEGKGTLNLAEYIKKIISSAVHCFSNEVEVVTHITTDEINISEDNYFELSLILNEWVTNSIKYAAIPDNRLKIKVSVRQQTREICIDYSDSGTVTSSSVNPPGLGTQIIHLLTVQMGARLTTGAHPYHYQLCIPDGT